MPAFLFIPRVLERRPTPRLFVSRFREPRAIGGRHGVMGEDYRMCRTSVPGLCSLDRLFSRTSKILMACQIRSKRGEMKEQWGATPTVRVHMIANVVLESPNFPDQTSTRDLWPEKGSVPIVTPSMTLRQIVDRVITPWENAVREKVTNFNERGSGWILKDVIGVDMHLMRYVFDELVHGVAGFELPVELAKASNYEIQNRASDKDDCFRLAMEVCMSRHATGKVARGVKDLRSFGDMLDWTGVRQELSRPRDFDKLEKNNPDLALNIWNYTPTLNSNRNEKKSPHKCVPGALPFRLSDRASAKYRCDLLRFVSPNDANEPHVQVAHLVAMGPKSLDALMSKLRGGQNAGYCERCLAKFSATSFRLQEVDGVEVYVKWTWQQRLAEHKKDCDGGAVVRKKMPKPSQSLLKINLKGKSDVQYWVVADIEAYSLTTGLMIPTDQIASWTVKTGEQIVCMVGAAIIDGGSVVEYYETPGADLNDALGAFLEWLNAAGELIFKHIAQRERNWRAGATKEHIAIWANSQTCVVCQTDITEGDEEDGNGKCFHHNPFTKLPYGTGACHLRCNSSIQVQKCLNVYFHNSSYDLAFIIRRIARDSSIIGDRTIQTIPSETVGKYLCFELKSKMDSKQITLRQDLSNRGEWIYTHLNGSDHPWNHLKYRDIASKNYTFENGRKLTDYILDEKNHLSVAKYLRDLQAVRNDKGLLGSNVTVKRRAGCSIKILDSLALFGQDGAALGNLVASRMPVQRDKYASDKDWYEALKLNMVKVRKALTHTSKLYKTEDEMLAFSLKGIFPFAHLTCKEVLDETELPPLENDCWVSSLSNKRPPQDEYDRAVNTMIKYCGGGTKGALGRFLRRYLKADVYLLVDCLSYLQSTISDATGLNVLNYLTGPQCAWDCMVIKSVGAGYKIRLLDDTQADMVGFLSPGLYGGIVNKSISEIHDNKRGNRI